ncbi:MULTISPECIES: class I SAM-dependent methyltransferase [Vagococcus]|uniref:Ribosomal RNA small subunit methyltransferase C n=1 Tax=Vagococcus fluvialis bH819 TaxID=1255619 RepID=A0A1X6WLP9_9ENTE|nr:MULTISPECIES: class I SAM-dependent methyltransferase [Vagococcus]SLM85162.1 Ribosomal RNA small subunit methyltransferase C [Vagococcus fluvialis bH819]HCM88425.1 class I SAM-dependent methyltransferase [Vagococcus sp.]
MNNHYYTNQPEVAHNRKQWTFPLKGKTYTFMTDSNVFSKGTVDFGSRVLIETFTADNLPEGAILDVGCGYGPIGLSLASDTGRAVEMVDVNERAVELAKENAELNKIDHVTIYTSFIYESVENNQFAAIVSNPPIRAGKEVVHTIISGSHEKLVKGGTLTIVIQKKQGAPSAKAKMEEVFGNAEIVKKEKGYFIIVSEKE